MPTDPRAALRATLMEHERIRTQFPIDWEALRFASMQLAEPAWALLEWAEALDHPGYAQFRVK
jgi:hypothetical protein